MYTVGESDGNARVCVLTNIGHVNPLDVVITPVMNTSAENPAFGESKHALAIVLLLLLALNL